MQEQKTMQKEIIIVGAGYTGLAAALDLCKAGYAVTIYEKDSDIGGLAGTFELSPGVRVEKFYHHWFTSDVDVLNLIDELGLSHLKQYRSSNTGLYFTNSIFRLASPLDLLSFSPLPLIDRIRTGFMALFARKVNNWKPLEHISAEDWLIKYGGRKAYSAIWNPLMQGKFGVEATSLPYGCGTSLSCAAQAATTREARASCTSAEASARLLTGFERPFRIAA